MFFFSFAIQIKIKSLGYQSVTPMVTLPPPPPSPHTHTNTTFEAKISTAFHPWSRPKQIVTCMLIFFTYLGPSASQSSDGDASAASRILVASFLQVYVYAYFPYNILSKDLSSVSSIAKWKKTTKALGTSETNWYFQIATEYAGHDSQSL